MAKKVQTYELEVSEKNQILEKTESIFRASEPREARLYEELFAYIEEIINDAATQARKNGIRTRTAEKSDD